MKQFYKDTSILLLFFLILLFKDSIYGLLIKVDNLNNLDARIIDIKKSYYEEEYNKLLSSINLVVDNNYNYTYSKILYRDIYEYFDEITILKGSEDGIKLNSAVINEYGLIGTIVKVNKNSSVVSLITNKDSQISIKVNNTYGILKYQDNKLTIKSINNYEDIEIGDEVITSGIGKLPQGITIGKVTKVLINDLGIEKTVIVETDVNFNNIDYVAILQGVKQ